ncbi:MAG: retroviral-like aspartic protease family protein [Acidobacteria bacterium]|nr:retroviral-like aspartic protease family protein [Acidobacteriota bacterium]MCI0722085.1 retroviral-like aspartic protease family protein [Acidobacteriota bacterium]
MTFVFDPAQGLIIVQTELEGPSGAAILRLALDTGATSTLINAGMLLAIGCDPALSPDRLQVTTGSGVGFVPRAVLRRIVALGRNRASFPVLCHTLPTSAGVDGLLGLDFLRDHILTIDFQAGLITLQ